MNKIYEHKGAGLARDWFEVECAATPNFDEQKTFLVKHAKDCHAMSEDGLVLLRCPDVDAYAARFWTRVEAEMFKARADFWLKRYGNAS